MSLRLPGADNFLWGTATAAHQIEGNNTNSDFWVVEHVTPTLFREPSGDACDSYHRYDEDAALAADLGFNAHRFGIEWARIEPEPGRFSEAALDHYARVLDSCRRRGLSPMVTLSHWTVPRWFAARGGFEEADSADLFARFANVVGRRLGDQMAAVTTFNEANIGRLVRILFNADGPRFRAASQAMFAAGAAACGSDRFASVLFPDLGKTESNQIAAHKAAVQALKADSRDLPVGLTLTMQAIESVEPGADTERMTCDLYGEWLEAAEPCDFVGVQTYTRIRVGATGPLPPPDNAERTAAGYEFYPQALGRTIRFAAERFGKPIFVTENGIATDDDSRRIAFIDAALVEVRNARADGIDVRGYFHWSLLDNFEWTAGYAQRFGLVAVDRATFARDPKPSAWHLGRIATRHPTGP